MTRRDVSQRCWAPGRCQALLSALTRRPTPMTDESATRMRDHVHLAEGITERAVSIDGEAGRLAGVLTETEREGPVVRPVLIVHGWATYRVGPHGLLVQLARGLAELGAPSLRFDLRGRGESEGEYNESDLDGMIADATACARWLCERFGVDGVAAFGMCAGGNVAAGAAALGAPIGPLVVAGMLPYQSEKSSAERKARARSMRRAFWAKLFSRESWKKLFAGRIRWGRVLGNLSGREAKGGGGAATDAAGDDGGPKRNLRDSVHDIPSKLAEYQGNILLIFGGADEEGRAAQAHFELFAERNRLNAFFHVIEGANHNFYAAEWTEALVDRTVDFVAIERDG